MKNSDDSTSFHFIRPLPLPPIIYATIDLCFASYLPIDALNEIIGLQATEAAPRSAMRINPLPENRIRDIGFISFLQCGTLTVWT